MLRSAPLWRTACLESRRASHAVVARDTHPRLAQMGPLDVSLALHVSYFSAQFERTPHPVHMLERLAQVCLDDGDVPQAARFLGALASAPSAGVCMRDDTILLDALRRGVHSLCRRRHCAPVSPAAAARFGGVPMHAAVALATIYDRCREAHITLPNAALSALVPTLAAGTQADTLIELLDVIAADVERSVAHEGEKSDLASVFTALLTAYGKAGASVRGEALLERLGTVLGASCTTAQLARLSCAASARFRMANKQASAAYIPRDIPLYNAWASYTDVWNALVRGRTAAGEMAAARAWLERFRLVSNVPRHELTALGITPPVRTASPYLTMMHALSSARGINAHCAQLSATERRALHSSLADERAPFKSAAMAEVLRLVRADRVVPGVAMLNFLAAFEAGRGRTSRAVALVREAMSLERGPRHAALRTHGAPGGAGLAVDDTAALRVHISTFPVVFGIYAALAAEKPTTSLQRIALQLPGKPMASICTPRDALASCVALVEWAREGRAPRRVQRDVHTWTTQRGPQLLNSALDALLSVNDFAAALYVLRLYDAWGIAPDTWTTVVVWRRVSLLPLAPGAASVMRRLSQLASADAVLTRAMEAGDGGHVAEVSEHIDRVRRALRTR